MIEGVEVDRTSCPRCGSPRIRKNGKSRGDQRWQCLECRRSFGARTGTPMHGLHTPAEEVRKALLMVMRRGSLRSAEEITGHKYETIGKWLRRAGGHAKALTEELVEGLDLDEVEVDAFWSFVGNESDALRMNQLRYRRVQRVASPDRGGVD
jgi:transposase-like protein